MLYNKMGVAEIFPSHIKENGSQGSDSKVLLPQV
jgi:hypothetical protein